MATQQVGVITGASSGIGAATARMLAADGARLVLHGRRRTRLDALVEGLPDGAAVAIDGDIVDPATPRGLIDTAVDRFGRVDWVLNNAGVLHVEPLDRLDIEKTCEMVRINVESAYRMAYVAVRHFQAHGDRGTLINTSSILGTKVRPTAGWYAGTKYAIEALSEALRIELAGTGIHVACVEPGLGKTDLHREWDEPSDQRLGIDQPLQPEDIARCVQFILAQPPHVRVPRLMVLPGEHAI